MNSYSTKWGNCMVQGACIVLLGLWHLWQPFGNGAISGIILMISGISGLFEWLANRQFDRSSTDLVWSVVTTLTGMLLLEETGETSIQIKILACWFTITAAWLMYRGWQMSWIFMLGWSILFLGLITAWGGTMAILRHSTESFPVQKGNLLFFPTGIAIIALGFLKKKIINSW